MGRLLSCSCGGDLCKIRANCWLTVGSLDSHGVGTRYDHPVEEIAAFILAGGHSTRMGTDKAFLEVGGQSLLTHAIALARPLASEVRIVGDTGKFAAYGSVIEDVYRERGPLGGIHAALAATNNELNLLLAVDLPFLTPGFLKYLIATARDCGAVVTVPHAAGGYQPLCAVYRREFAVVAESSLRAGRNKIDALFSEVATRIINEEELLGAGFSAEMFRNLNTPGEWEAAKSR